LRSGTAEICRDVDQRRAGGAARTRHHVGQGEGLQLDPHVVTDFGPHGEQHALTLVVARTVGVGEAEVTRGDGPVDGGDDLGEGDLLWRPGQYVAAAHAALGAHQASALEGEQDLLEVRLGKGGALCDVAHRRRRRLGAVEGQ